MELKTIESCDNMLDELHVILGIYKASFEFNEKMVMLHTGQMDLARNQMNITRNQMNEIELRKKELCQTESNSKPCLTLSQSTAANAVIEDYARPANMCVKVARMLND